MALRPLLRRLSDQPGWRPPAAWRRLLALAAADGWAALYDPTNPNTRTLRESGGSFYCEALADGLGNLPTLVQASEAAQPLLEPGGFGALDALAFSGATTYMDGATGFGPHAQPNFRAALLRNLGGAGIRFAVSATDTSARNLVGINNTGELLRLRVSAGTLVDTGLEIADREVVVGALFNGASSRAYVDSVESGALNPGAEGSASLRLGTNPAATGSFWHGTIGPVLLFDGAPSVEVRDRMLDLLHALSGIAKAE